MIVRPVAPDFPLQSLPLKSRLDEAYGTLVDLIGYVSPSGTVDVQGLYDLLDTDMVGYSQSLINKNDEGLPAVLQLIEEFHYARSHNPEEL